jgi:hypothetical protein
MQWLADQNYNHNLSLLEPNVLPVAGSEKCLVVNTLLKQVLVHHWPKTFLCWPKLAIRTLVDVNAQVVEMSRNSGLAAIQP